MDVGVNVGVTFAGRPLTDSATALLKPFKADVLMVTEPLFPCGIETEFGEAEMLKLGGCGNRECDGCRLGHSASGSRYRQGIGASRSAGSDR